MPFLILLVALALVAWTLYHFRPEGSPEIERKCRWVVGDAVCDVPTEGGRALCRRHRELLRKVATR